MSTVELVTSFPLRYKDGSPKNVLSGFLADLARRNAQYFTGFLTRKLAYLLIVIYVAFTAALLTVEFV